MQRLLKKLNAPTNEELLRHLEGQKCPGMDKVYWVNIFLEGKEGKRVKELSSSLEEGYFDVLLKRALNLGAKFSLSGSDNNNSNCSFLQRRSRRFGNGPS